MIEKVTNFNNENIEHLKIYFDGFQYRFKLKCAVCGKIDKCMCYDTIEEAYEEAKLRFLCDEHYIKELGIDYINIIDNVLDTEYEKYLESNNFNKKSIKEVDKIINNLTKNQCEEIMKEIDNEFDNEFSSLGTECYL